MAELNSADQANLFRRSMLRLSLLVDEQSDDLNTLMDQLRATLRDPELKESQLESVLTDSENTQERNIARDKVKRDKLNGVLKELNEQLRAYSPEQTRELDELGHGIELRTRDTSELTLYLWEYKGIQASVMDRLKAVNATAAALESVEQTVGRAQGADTTSGEPEEELIAQMSKEVFDAVTGLANRIQLPPDKHQQLQAIIHELNRSIEWQDLIALLNRLIELIVSVLNDEQRALEQYLEELNKRLTFIRSSVQKAQSIRNEFQQEGKALDQRIQGHVNTIRREVSQATSLSQLKTGISDELDDIVSSIDQFLQESAEKERSMSDMMAELVDIITDLESQNQSILDDFERTRKQAMTDLLTGLPNRSAYNQRLQEEYERFQRYGSPLTLCVLDVDYFKSVNDELGHSAGDKVLKILARQLRKLLRETDFISRHGGEEFIILLPETDLTDALVAMEKLRRLVEETPFHFRGKPVPITVSIGCAEFQTGNSTEAVFDRADHAMYRAKDKGRNRVES